MTDPATDAGYMARALKLAARGRYTTHPNPRVGCVIVADGQVVGEGWHQRAGGPHAELLALREAGERARGADVYVTLEPCSHTGRTGPCDRALIEAGVARVIAAARDPNPEVSGRGLDHLRAAGIPVVVGLMENAARRLNRGFFQRMQKKRPWVRLKLASSLDGRTAMASGESQWITGIEARNDVHRLRAEAGAVLTGSATVLADNPAMTVRIDPPPGLDAWIQPARIVIDSRLQSPASAEIFADGARRLVLTTSRDSARRAQLEARGVEVQVLAPAEDGSVPLAQALKIIAAHEINEVLLECGPRLAGAMVRAGLVDEMIVYLAPKLLGDTARPLAVLPGIERLADAVDLDIRSIRAVGRDLRLTAIPRPRPRPAA